MVRGATSLKAIEAPPKEGLFLWSWMQNAYLKFSQWADAKKL
jgi:hypothetical protein